MNDVNITCFSDTVMLFLVHWEFYLRRSLIPRYTIWRAIEILWIHGRTRL